MGAGEVSRTELQALGTLVTAIETEILGNHNHIVLETMIVLIGLAEKEISSQAIVEFLQPGMLDLTDLVIVQRLHRVRGAILATRYPPFLIDPVIAGLTMELLSVVVQAEVGGGET